MRRHRRREKASRQQPRRTSPDTYSHAIPAMQEEATALIAGLVFAE